MGRYYSDKKATVEESCNLTVFRLKERGMLNGGHTATVIEWVMKNTGKESSIGLEVNMTGEPYARFVYSIVDGEGNSTPYDYKINLVATPCNFGGVRYWFVCPECLRNVGGLYLAPGERYFKCRKCNNLTYHSRNRCIMAALGHTSRQTERLRSEIKRWTWGDRPTRKVRKLRKLERKEGILASQAWKEVERLKVRSKFVIH